MEKILILRNDRSLLLNTYGEFAQGRADNYKDVTDVTKALNRLGYKTDEFVVKDDLSNISELRKIPGVLAFNLCDDFPDPKKEALLLKELDANGIAYTGDSFGPLRLCLEKAKSKKKLLDFGVRVPKYQLVSSTKEQIQGLSYPLILKPNNEHGGVGIEEDSVVYNQEQLQKKLNEMIRRYGKALIEEYVDGREFSTVVFGDKVMRVSEMIFDGEDFAGKPTIINYEAKWLENTQDYKATKRETPAKLPTELEKMIKEESRKAYNAFGCKSYARIDLRLDKEGIPYVLEVNVNPDLSRGGALAKIAQGSGMSFLKLVKNIVGIAKPAADVESQKNELKTSEEKTALREIM